MMIRLVVEDSGEEPQSGEGRDGTGSEGAGRGTEK